MHWWGGWFSWGHMYPWSPWLFPFMGVFWGLGGLAWLLVGLVAALLVYGDARRRYPRGSLAPLLWAVGVLVGGLLVLLLYLLARPGGLRGGCGRRSWGCRGP